MISRSRSAAVLAGALGAATLSLLAQSPAPQAPPSPAPAPAAQGRGGRGGPQMWEPDFTKKDPIRALTPAEEAKRFWLPPGFRLEPVLADPDIEEPAQIAFDGNGRMFVLELRGYMQDADATGELDPVGRISVHEDRDGDGIYETHKVFVDKLIFPRFVLPFGANAILTKESNADEVWKFTDTNGDGTADKKELFATGLGRSINVEHQESGFVWALDNWIYSTINSARIRWTPNGVLREPTGSNGGQWGVTQDNHGKVWFQAGASGMPGYFQTPIVYGNFPYPQQFEDDLNITWGAPVRIADMQGGMGVVRMPDGSLARATGAAGNDVYRGDRLPKDMLGDYFYGEVVARIVRRLRPVKTEGLTQLQNVYPLSEFIRSTDPLFRPVDLTTAPDGTMYITDMYRGIIQESQWSGPGTYLRQRIDQYALDKVVRHGRIWRLTYDGMGRRTEAPRMLSETPSQLVAHLDDANGWWRDSAQQLLVLKQDKSVVPVLQDLVRKSPNQLARIHALWTLEGLGSADRALVRELMEDKDPQIRIQATRVSETLYKAGDRTFTADYKNLAKDPDTEVVMQALMTLNTLKVADSKPVIQGAMAASKAKGVQLIAGVILNPPATAGRGGLESFGASALTKDEQALLEKGRDIYSSVCFTCHGEDGRGEPMPGAAAGTTRAPSLASSPRVVGHHDYVIKVLLHGLTGPVNGNSYTEVMVPMGQSGDEWVAAIASYVRNSFGNRASLVTPAEVGRVRAETAARKAMWTTAELEASLPKMIPGDGLKFTASHNPQIAMQAVGINPWTSGYAQQPGMWFQVELPQPATIAEVQFTSTAAVVDTTPAVPGAPTRTGVPGAGRGAAGAPGAAPAAPPALGFPRQFQVQVSMDGARWSEPVARGTGGTTQTDIAFKPTRAKFVRITQTAAADAPWTIQRLRLYEPGTPSTGTR